MRPDLSTFGFRAGAILGMMARAWRSAPGRTIGVPSIPYVRRLGTDTPWRRRPADSRSRRRSCSRSGSRDRCRGSTSDVPARAARRLSSATSSSRNRACDVRRRVDGSDADAGRRRAAVSRRATRARPRPPRARSRRLRIEKRVSRLRPSARTSSSGSGSASYGERREPSDEELAILGRGGSRLVPGDPRDLSNRRQPVHALGEDAISAVRRAAVDEDVRRPARRSGTLPDDAGELRVVREDRFEQRIRAPRLEDGSPSTRLKGSVRTAAATGAPVDERPRSGRRRTRPGAPSGSRRSRAGAGCGPRRVRAADRQGAGTTERRPGAGPPSHDASGRSVRPQAGEQRVDAVRGPLGVGAPERSSVAST